MSSFSSTDGQSKSNYAGMSERRSIDYIPESERHGHPFSQFTLWFGGNLQITAIVTGALAVVLGGDVVWSLVGLLVGQMLGAAVMSLHALQGPRLGLPQMILSRAQFGVFGAVVPLVLVCVMYIGFSASGTVLAGQAMAKLLNISHVAGMLIFSAIIIVIAVLGYKVILSWANWRVSSEFSPSFICSSRCYFRPISVRSRTITIFRCRRFY